MTETKNNLSALIDQVRQGETIVILDRGRPVARIESILEGEVDPEGRIARLERAGLVRRPKHGSAKDVLAEPPPKMRSGASALAILLEERKNGR